MNTICNQLQHAPYTACYTGYSTFPDANVYCGNQNKCFIVAEMNTICNQLKTRILCGPLCDEYKQQAKITKVKNQPTESPTLSFLLKRQELVKLLINFTWPYVQAPFGHSNFVEFQGRDQLSDIFKQPIRNVLVICLW
jgi:hypothetical protein